MQLVARKILSLDVGSSTLSGSIPATGGILVDTPDLGSGAVRRESSSLSWRIWINRSRTACHNERKSK